MPLGDGPRLRNGRPKPGSGLREQHGGQTGAARVARPERGAHDARVLRTASDHADLTFHALAFVPPRIDAPALVHAASIHRPAWMRFAEEHLPPDAVVPIARDAPLLGALTLAPETALAFQRFATLHDSVASFLATVRLALADLDPSAVSRPADLAELRALPQAPIEIFRAALGLAARSFAAAHASTLRPFAERVLAAFAPRWRALSLELPGVADLRLHLSATLGPHGRLAGDDLLMGTLTLPDDTGPPDTDTPLTLAAHEASVRAAGLVLRARGAPAPWPHIERVALDAAERAYRGTTVELAYMQWRSGISTGGVAPRDRSTLALSEEAASLLAAAPAPPPSSPE